MTAQWQHIVTSVWAHWADVDLADAWFRHAAALASEETAARLDRAPFAQQRANVRAAWAALANGYRALDLRPWVDPQLRTIWRRWYGPCFAADMADARAQRVRGLVARGRDRRRTTQLADTIVAQRVAAQWARLGKAPINERYGLCELIARVSLSEETELVELCAAGRDGEGLCGFEGLFIGCADDGATRESCEPYTWRSLTWHDPPPLDVLTPEDQFCRVAKVLPPLVWSLEIARELADACVSRGASQVLDDSRRHGIVRNLTTAHQLGLLERRDLGTPREQQALNEAARRALSVETRIESAQFDDGRMNELAALSGGAVALATAANPLLGIIFAGFAGALRLLFGFFGFAVGFDIDELGRAKPVFELWHLTGGPGPSSRPTHDVPAPPGYVARTPTSLMMMEFATPIVVNPRQRSAPLAPLTEAALPSPLATTNARPVDLTFIDSSGGGGGGGSMSPSSRAPSSPPLESTGEGGTLGKVAIGLGLLLLFGGRR